MLTYRENDEKREGSIPISSHQQPLPLLEQLQSIGTFERTSRLVFSCSKHPTVVETRQENRAPTCNQILELDCSPAGGCCYDMLHWSVRCLLSIE